jgi:hypothetical protein
MSEVRFPIGRTMQTRGAQDQVAWTRALDCLHLHQQGDWGAVDANGAQANEAALREGARILSVYLIDPSSPELGKFWIITEADRSATTVLLPEEY